MKRLNFGFQLLLKLLPVVLALTTTAVASLAADKTVPLYQRFEQSFESAADYANPAQEVSLAAVFTAPSGEKLKVPGFWDGGKTWRIRFVPTQTGKWKFETTCSDAGNKGLHQKSGEFTVTTATGTTSLAQHGPITVSTDGRYLVHHDGTPFLWVGDTAWNGPLLSSTAEWDHYLKERSRQKFNAVQWVATQFRAAPDGDAKKQLAYTGTDKIVINPAFFQRLDEKVDAMNKAGLVSVPVLLWAINGGGNPKVNPGVSLPEDQAILLARYMVARWSGNASAWILGGDGDYRGEKAEKWKRIGRAVFNDIAHGPVTMHPGGMQWVWKEFIDEKWYGFVGYQSGHGDDDKTLKWITEGPLTDDWARLPHRPFINLEPPYENHIAYQSKKPISPEITRRAIYWSLLCAPTAGVTYGGHGVWGWDDGTKPPTDHPGTGIPLPWQKALTMPAAEQMAHLADFFASIDWWKLRPAPVVVVNNPGAQTPAKFIAGAKTDDKELMVVYVPEDRTVEIKLEMMPPSPNVTWFNPRTGEKSPAVAVVTASTCQFPTPAEGDWILFMKTDKKQGGEAEKPKQEKPAQK
jgi:Protein of unknown function (DUF4038)/Domain of unknown function (DUF5060)/Putative collagen-binding domain of a collagenase